jgi:hypothetical protein
MSKLFDAALESINRVAEDTSVPDAAVVSRLEQLREEIDLLIDALDEDE